MDALSKGYYVEVDIWKVGDLLYLGHDNPEDIIDEHFLENEKIISHAKNIEAFHHLLMNKKIHTFFHDKDYCTLTSKGWVWKYPEIYFEGRLIAICSDWL